MARRNDEGRSLWLRSEAAVAVAQLADVLGVSAEDFVEWVVLELRRDMELRGGPLPAPASRTMTPLRADRVVTMEQARRRARRRRR
jgi:hypothetical protein